MPNDKLAAIEAELARQNEALEEVTTTLGALDGSDLRVPQAFFDQMNDVCAPCDPNPTARLFAIRG